MEHPREFSPDWSPSESVGAYQDPIEVVCNKWDNPLEGVQIVEHSQKVYAHKDDDQQKVTRQLLQVLLWEQAPCDAQKEVDAFLRAFQRKDLGLQEHQQEEQWSLDFDLGVR